MIALLWWTGVCLAIAVAFSPFSGTIEHARRAARVQASLLPRAVRDRARLVRRNRAASDAQGPPAGGRSRVLWSLVEWRAPAPAWLVPDRRRARRADVAAHAGPAAAAADRGGARLRSAAALPARRVQADQYRRRDPAELRVERADGGAACAGGAAARAPARALRSRYLSLLSPVRATAPVRTGDHPRRRNARAAAASAMADRRLVAERARHRLRGDRLRSPPARAGAWTWCSSRATTRRPGRRSATRWPDRATPTKCSWTSAPRCGASIGRPRAAR